MLLKDIIPPAKKRVQQPIDKWFQVALLRIYVLKKTMRFRKRHALTMLFSVYFLLYVLSPFCFTKVSLSDSSENAYQLNLSIKELRVVWELFLSGTDKQNDTEDSGHSVQLLIKKARALVNKNSPAKFNPSDSAEFVFNLIDFSPKYFASVPGHVKHEYRTGFYLSLSGLSPPSLS